MLETPTAEAGARRDGVSYRVSQMDWYWKLSSALLEDRREAVDLGKSKAMLLITIVDELERQIAQLEQQSSTGTAKVSYFFFQDTNKDLINAIAVLKGLAYFLAVQHPPLVSHLRASYDHAGSKLFDGAGSSFAPSVWGSLTLHRCSFLERSC